MTDDFNAPLLDLLWLCAVTVLEKMIFERFEQYKEQLFNKSHSKLTEMLRARRAKEQRAKQSWRGHTRLENRGRCDDDP
jgi:hypothetical protein